MRIKVILQNTSITHLTFVELISKTFIKINDSQGTNNTSTIINDTSEKSTLLVSQDDSLIPKLRNDTLSCCNKRHQFSKLNFR
jgi:hypothetical protein